LAVANPDPEQALCQYLWSLTVTPKNYDDIKTFLKKCLERRNDASLPDSLRPSGYWEYFIAHFAYVPLLSNEELKRIRYHTYHLTGDYYVAYTHQPEASFAPLHREYQTLVDETGGYLAGEEEGGFGHEIGGAKVTIDTVRYMQVLADLLRTGVLERSTPVRIMEIGGGYGGLARSMMNFNPRAAYVICDLEETQFFQAVHLANNFGFNAVELCEDGITAETVLEPGRFYLLPQRCADTIPPDSIDIVINQQSLQEMTADQIQRYVDVIKRASRFFYSCNSQHNDAVATKMQIVKRLQELIDGQFHRIVWQSRSSSMGRNAQRAIKLARQLIGRPPRRLGDYNLRRVLYDVAAGHAERR
jgi:putative sugar O-methyltransferase